VVSNINCPSCKQPVPTDAHVCPHCGTKLQAQFQPGRLSPTKLTRSLPDVVKQFDTSASTNIMESGVLIAFYSGAIFAGRVLSTSAIYALVYALPLCLLLASVIFALRVFYLDGYLTDDYLTLIRKKEQRLQFSSLFLEVAIGVLIIAVVVYLFRPALRRENDSFQQTATTFSPCRS